MKYKKMMILAIIFTCLLAVSAVSAADSAKEDIIVTNDTKDVVSSIDDDVLGVGENQILERENTDVLSSDSGSFDDLNDLIDDADEDSSITLDMDYVYDDGDDKDEIVIDKNLEIDGAGHTIDAKGKARIFHIKVNCTVELRNVTIQNGYTDEYEGGGAIFNEGFLTVRDSIFYNNTADNVGGAMYGSADMGGCAAINCTFTKNHAGYGGGAGRRVDASL